MNRPLVPLVFAVLLALGLAGCGADTRPVARVGKDAITVDDYLAGARGAGAQYPFPPDSARSVFVEDLIRRKLLLEEAANRGLFDDTLTIHFRHLKEEELLTQAMGAEMAPANIAVSEAETRALYEQRKTSAHVQLVYAFSEAAAHLAAERARRGEDFTTIADQMNPPGMLPPHGDIGEQLPGNMVAPLDDYVRDAKPGTIAGPLEAPAQGWFVIRVVSRTPHAQNAYEVERPQLAEMLRQRKQRAVAIARYKRLREGYALRLEPGGAQAIFHHFNQPPAGGAASYPAEERGRVLARWQAPDGPHAYTFAEALADLDIADREKPNVMLLPSIEQWILVEASRRIQVAEARRRGFTLDPQWRRQLDETVNNYVLDALYQSEILSHTMTPNEDDARAIYARNPARFEQLDAAHLEVMAFADSAALQAFLRHPHHSGGDLKAMAAMAPGSPPVEDVTVSFPNADPDWAPMAQSLRAMNRGDAIGPFPMHGRLVIAMMMSKDTHATPFDLLPATERAQLLAEGGEVARERHFLTLLEELKRRYPVVRNESLLRKLPWPVNA